MTQQLERNHYIQILEYSKWCPIVLGWITSLVGSWYRDGADVVADVIGLGRGTTYRERPHVRRDVTTDVIDRHRDRQPWIGAVLLMVIAGGILYPPVALGGLLACGLGAFALGLVDGRYWCDWFCPRGSFLDTAVRRFSRGKPAPDVLRHPLFRLAVLLWFMAFVLGIGVVAGWGDPVAMSIPALRLLVVSTVVAVVLGTVFHERTWCLFCPMGTVANAVDRIATALGRDEWTQVTIDAEACIDCHRCQSVCRQQISPNEHTDTELTDHGDVFNLTAGPTGDTRTSPSDVVDHGDCLKCGYCVDECPTGALHVEGSSWFPDSGGSNQ